MAKVAFSKLDAKICDTITTLCYHNAKGEEIFYEVKNYLPIEEKMEMISKIINQSVDDNGFYNPIRLHIYTVLEMTYAYTNLNFTSKQKDNPFKLYDLLVSTKIFDDIKNCLEKEEWNEIEQAIVNIIDNIYKYRNSIMGILDAVSQDYGDLNLNASTIQEKIADPNNLELLKNILTKLG